MIVMAISILLIILLRERIGNYNRKRERNAHLHIILPNDYIVSISQKTGNDKRFLMKNLFIRIFERKFQSIDKQQKEPTFLLEG